MGREGRKKELLAAYKERAVVGGVCAIRCVPAGRTLVFPAPDPRAQRNRFDFSVSTNTCIFAALKADWALYGAGSFTFELLEELEKAPEETPRAFREELEVLCQAWRERLAEQGAQLYQTS